MKTYIILLRGVMPFGKNKVPMAELRKVLQKAGLKEVQTYIQTGNIIAQANLTAPEIEKLVHEVIKKEIGADIVVVVKTALQFSTIVDKNPFITKETEKLYFTLFSRTPEKNLLKQFYAGDYSPEKVSVIGDVVYTLYATKYRDSKFKNNFIERKLSVSVTTRNFNTMRQQGISVT